MNWHSRAAKHRRASRYFRVAVHDGQRFSPHVIIIVDRPEFGPGTAPLQTLQSLQANVRLNRETVLLMKTTLDIDDSLILQLREEAARRGTTMSMLVEAGLRRILAERARPASPSSELSPLPTWAGGRELVDISNRNSLYKAMEEE